MPEAEMKHLYISGEMFKINQNIMAEYNNSLLIRSALHDIYLYTDSIGILHYDQPKFNTFILIEIIVVRHVIFIEIASLTLFLRQIIV